MPFPHVSGKWIGSCTLFCGIISVFWGGRRPRDGGLSTFPGEPVRSYWEDTFCEQVACCVEASSSPSGVFVPWGTRHCERGDSFVLCLQSLKGAISTAARRGLLWAQNALAMTEGGGCPKLQTLAACRAGLTADGPGVILNVSWAPSPPRSSLGRGAFCCAMTLYMIPCPLVSGKGMGKRMCPAGTRQGEEGCVSVWGQLARCSKPPSSGAVQAHRKTPFVGTGSVPEDGD